MKIEITVELLNKVLAYLGTRPYQEVFQIIQAVQKEAEENLKGKQSDGGIGGDQTGGA